MTELPILEQFDATATSIVGSREKEPSALSAQGVENDTSMQSFPSTREESLQSSATMALNSQPQSTIKFTRITDPSAYGDFSFGRFVTRKRFYRRPKNIYALENNFPVEERSRDTFRRTGSFPYFKLPLEIRHQILRLLLGPFYRFCEYTQKSYIPLTLEEHRVPYRNRKLAGHFFDYINLQMTINIKYHADQRMRQGLDPVALSLLPPLERPSLLMSEKEFYDAKAREKHCAKAHPLREGFESMAIDTLYNAIKQTAEEDVAEEEEEATEKKIAMRLIASPYKLDAHPLMSFKEGFSLDKDWSMIELIQNLSQVSYQFRQELGRVFWTRVHMKLNWKLPPIEMVPFLAGRGAVHKGIKSLTLRIDDDNWYGNNHFNNLEFVCLLIAKHLVLEELHVILVLSDTTMNDILEGNDFFIWDEQLRSIVVTEHFKFNLRINIPDFPWEDFFNQDDAEKEYRRRVAYLQDENEYAFEKLLTPTSIRVDYTDFTDQENWLFGRSHTGPLMNLPVRRKHVYENDYYE